MFPNFVLFGKTIGLYPLMSLIGIFVAGLFICYLTKKHGYSVDDMITFLLICACGVLLGGHLLYGLINFPLLLEFFSKLGSVSSFEEFINNIILIFGGSVFYGGLLGGILVGVIYGKKSHFDLKNQLDFFAPAVPLFHVFGRIGCFLGGCCYGIECNIGFVYSHSLVPIADGVTRFPVQLVESAFNLFLFLLLFGLLQKNIMKGKLFFLYLILYPIGRFLLEFLRGDVYRGIYFGLSTSQWISLLLIIISTIILLSSRQKTHSNHIEKTVS